MADTEHTPTEPAEHRADTEAAHSTLGPTIGIIIIVALLIAGGFYFWGTQFEFTTPAADETGQQDDGETTTESLREVGTSTDADAIEQDLDNTNLDDIDRELEQIEAELGA